MRCAMFVVMGWLMIVPLAVLGREAVPPRQESPHQAAGVTANNSFGIDVYRQLAEAHDKNLFFSPYSIHSALLMTAEGARGNTLQEMGKVLRLPEQFAAGAAAANRPWNLAPVHEAAAALHSRLQPNEAGNKQLAARLAELRKQHQAAYEKMESAGQQDFVRQARHVNALAAEINALLPKVNAYEIRAANALWVDISFPLDESYLRTISTAYRSGGAFPMDFQNDAERGRAQINGWAAEQTNNRIRDLLPPGSVSDQTRFVLTNAVYFKGEWQTPFHEHNTKREAFHLINGSSEETDIMHAMSLEVARYAAFQEDGSFFATPEFVPASGKVATYPGPNGFSMAELPYKGGTLSMVVIAPQTPAGISNIEQQLTAENLDRWIKQLRHRELHVLLPKFKTDTEYELRKTLQDLGMTEAFSARADFSGMTASQQTDHRLAIGGVLHKAFVEVNEKGTEAAAATAVRLDPAAAPEEEKLVPFVPTFSADRPFIFLIRERETGAILFLGRIVQPT